MCYVPLSHFVQGKIIYANHLPWYIAVIVVLSKSRDKWLKNKLPTLGRHISTFRGYQILFSIRNPYINRFTNHFTIHS
jgi:hypothetical protein